LRDDILKLREELLKPKSLEEVEREKVGLLARKALLLGDMHRISAQIKVNKRNATNVKF
jgi:hypothetical protein